MKAKEKQASFEDRLEELETITQNIRSGKLPLQNAIDEFEKGIGLAKGLEKDLARMQTRVEILLNKPIEEEPAEGKEPAPEVGLFD